MTTHMTYGWEGLKAVGTQLVSDDGDVRVKAKLGQADRFLHVNVRRNHDGQRLYLHVVLNAESLSVEALGVGDKVHDAYENAMGQLRTKGLVAETVTTKS